MKPPFIFISYSHRSEFVPWLHAATVEVMEKPCGYCRSDEGHIFDIGRSRQLQTELMLKTPEATHILFIDDDIVVPQRDALVKMFDWIELHNEHIISGLYYDKMRESKPLIMGCEQKEDGIHFGFPYSHAPPPKKSIIKVGAVPAGFLLVKREVFEKIPPPWFVLNAPQFKSGDARSSHKMGEDIYFSMKARKYGYNLWVDTRADLVQIGTRYFGAPDMVDLIDKQSNTMAMQAEEVHRQCLEKEKQCHTNETPNAPNAAGSSNVKPPS